MVQKVRVVRTNIGTAANDSQGRQQIWTRYSAIKALIRRSLPASSASALAEPVPAGDSAMDWHSELGGQPVPLSALHGAERARVEKLLDDRLGALRELAGRTPNDSIAHDLLRAAQPPSPEQVYVMNGQPVVIGWGLGEVGPQAAAPIAAAPTAAAGMAASAAIPPTPTPTPAAAAPAAAAGGAGAATAGAAMAAAAGTATTAETEPQRRGSRLWLWIVLGLLLLFLLLGFLLWWFWDTLNPKSDPLLPPTVEEPLTPPPAETPITEPPPQVDPMAALTAEEQVLRGQIAEAEAELRRRLNACPIPEHPLPVVPQNQDGTMGSLPAEPLPTEPPPKEPAVKDPTPTPAPPEETPPEVAKPDPVPEATPPRTAPPQPESKPTPPPAKPQAPAAKPPAAAKPAPQAEAPPAKPGKSSAAACPPPRKKWEAPELVVLLDRSGSMELRAQISQQEIEALYRRAKAGDPAARAKLNSMVGNDNNSRLGLAKSAVRGMLETLPADVDVGLVVFGQCSGAESFKFFRAEDRPRMLGLLNSITPQNGTPLARGLERAGTMVDGVSVPATIVVVTDGEDSCHGDPCAVARALKQAKPNLTINVVDVNGMGEGACMAQATGGKVFPMRSPDKLEDLIKKASGETPVPPGCE
jgi:hypothetical protein